MNYFDFLLRGVHIGSAIVLIGGAVFMRWMLLPSLGTLSESSQQELLTTLRRRWSQWVMLAGGLLLGTGLLNALLTIRRFEFEGGLYHILVSIKLVLALAAIGMASVLAGTSPVAERLRRRSKFWLDVNLTLAVLLVCVAGAMKMTDRTPKPTEDDRATVSRTTMSLPR